MKRKIKQNPLRNYFFSKTKQGHLRKSLLTFCACVGIMSILEIIFAIARSVSARRCRSNSISNSCCFSLSLYSSSIRVTSNSFVIFRSGDDEAEDETSPFFVTFSCRVSNGATNATFVLFSEDLRTFSKTGSLTGGETTLWWMVVVVGGGV